MDFFAARGVGSYAVSLRGHGRSAGRERLRWTSVADYVEDIARVAAALPRSPVVVGHSLGGLVVQRYLKTHAAPAAVLLAPSPARGMLRSGWRLFLRHPLLFMEVYLTLEPCRLYSTPYRARAFLFSPGLSDGKVAEYVARFGRESFRAFLEMAYSPPKPARVRETPVLVLGGASDVIVPPEGIERTARAYGATWKIFPGAAHDLMLEDAWEDVAKYMLEWLEQLPGSAAGLTGR